MNTTTNLFNLHSDILSDYKQFVSSFINISNEQIKQVVEEEIHTGRFWPEQLLPSEVESWVRRAAKRIAYRDEQYPK